MGAAVLFLLLTATPATAERELPTLAVLEVEDGGANLPADMRAKLSEQLVTAFRTSARYRLISPAGLKQRIAPPPECDRACRENARKATGADEVLTARVVRIGSSCALTARLSQLGGEEASATNEDDCSLPGLSRSVTALVARLLPVRHHECPGAPGRATFGSKPSGAAVFIDGVQVGTTPVSAMKLPANCPISIRLVAPDGRERNEHIELESNKTSIYNIAFEPLTK